MVKSKFWGKKILTLGAALSLCASVASEHMYSFDHVYTITALRDWLFNQHK
jgi:hypothetical protein